jgi:hypothetical protein
LAGLLQVKSETINSGLPVLSDMPYLGAMFRTTREEQNEIELLITVTPNFAGPMDPHEVPHNAPGTSTQSPTDKELYWRGYVETPVAADCAPGMGGSAGMIQYAPQNMQAPPMSYPTAQPSVVSPNSTGYGSGSYGPANYPTSGSMLPPPSPTPNPAAMSVGPNVPKLAQQPGAASQPGLYYPQTASGTMPALGPGTAPGMVTSGAIVR